MLPNYLSKKIQLLKNLAENESRGSMKLTVKMVLQFTCIGPAKIVKMFSKYYRPLLLHIRCVYKGHLLSKKEICSMVYVCLTNMCMVESSVDNPFHTTGLFLYPQKTSENLWFIYLFIFGGYIKRLVAWNRLMRNSLYWNNFLLSNILLALQNLEKKFLGYQYYSSYFESIFSAGWQTIWKFLLHQLNIF